MARTNGERWQDYQARRAYAVERAVATAAAQKERELKIELGIPLPKVEIPAPCTCAKYPGGHYHAIKRYGGEIERFKPGTWEAN